MALDPGWGSAGFWTRTPAILPPPPTVLDVVEDDKLLPAQLLHQRQHDVVEAYRRPGGQRVALPPGAGVEATRGAGRAVAVPLDVQVGDVHGVGQGLQGAGGGAARRGDEGQDSLVHQLTGWGGGDTDDVISYG